MPIVDGDYVPQTEDELRNVIETELQAQLGSNIDLTENSVLSNLARAVAAAIASNQEASLNEVYDAAYLETSSGESLDNVVAILGIERRDPVRATGVVEFTSQNSVTQDRVIQQGTRVQTDSDNPVVFETTESVTMSNGTSSVQATVRAVDGGSEGNLASNTLVVLPSPPNFVDGVTNPDPTGDPNFTDTSGTTLVVGRDEESDEELRDRAQSTITTGGDATVDALTSAVVNEVTGATSVRVYENPTSNDNTGSGGLPPYSFEAVVLGGNSNDVAQTIFETKAVTARSYGGARGTQVTETVTADNGQQFQLDFTRPSEVQIDMTLDLVVTDEFDGADAVRDAIVQYIGGTLSNGETVIGLGVGENVYIDRIENLATDAEKGVLGIDSSGTSYTPTTTTDSNNLDVIAVSDNEVAQTDGSDGSITINTTQI
jgi:uncharacterized phage protein gp47/JayE